MGDLNLEGADVLYSKNYGIHVDNQQDKKTGLTSTIGDLNLDGAMIYNSGKNGFYLSNKYGCTARDLRL